MRALTVFVSVRPTKTAKDVRCVVVHMYVPFVVSSVVIPDVDQLLL